MVRQFRARRYYLDQAIAAAEAEEAQLLPAAEGAQKTAPVSKSEDAHTAEGGEGLTPAKEKVAEVVAQYRFKNTAAIASFASSFLLGTLIVALIAVLPVYFAYVKLYDNPASPSLNVFTLMWRAFAGGFAGTDAGTTGASGWNIFYILSRTDGAAYSSVWGAFVNPVCLLLLAFAVGYGIWRIVCLVRTKTWGRGERRIVRELAVPLAGALVSAVAAIAAAEAEGFVLLFYLFFFALAASGVRALCEAEGKTGKIARICAWAAFGLLAAMFVLYFVFATGMPLPASLVTGLFG